jgi:hypothetical protein
MKYTRCQNKEEHFSQSEVESAPNYFFTINTSDVRALIVSVNRCASTHVWVVYYVSFALLY